MSINVYKCPISTYKCHLLLNSQKPNTLKIGDSDINNSLREKLLGITFSCQLKFKKHIKDIFKKPSQKLNAVKISTIHGKTKKRILMNALFKSQFNYSPLVWMRYNRSLNTKMNRLHEKCPRIVYNDKKTNFNELLTKDGSASIHHQNLQKFAVEMFDFSRGLTPEIVNELFQFREPIPHEIRRKSQFQLPFIHLVFSGTENRKFLGPKIWALVPNEMKESENLEKS